MKLVWMFLLGFGVVRPRAGKPSEYDDLQGIGKKTRKQVIRKKALLIVIGRYEYVLHSTCAPAMPSSPQ